MHFVLRTRRSGLCILLSVAGLFLLFQCAATAAPVAVTHVQNVGQVSLDGDLLYWSNGSSVHRVDLDTGTDTMIYRIPSGRGAFVDELVSRAGRLAFGVTFTNSNRGKYTADNHILAYDTATGTTAVVARGVWRTTGNSGLCGADLELGNVTSDGSVVLAIVRYTPNIHKCGHARGFPMSTVAVADRPVDPAFPPPLRSLAKIRGIVDEVRFTNPWLSVDTFLSSTKVRNLTTRATIDLGSRGYLPPFGTLDSSGNLLISKAVRKGSKLQFEWSIADGQSAFSNRAPLGTADRHVDFLSCGNRLLRARITDATGATSSITSIANPFLEPGAPTVDLLSPTTTATAALACDSSRAVFVVGKDSYTDQTIYLTPLAG